MAGKEIERARARGALGVVKQHPLMVLFAISPVLIAAFVVGAPLRVRGHLYNCGVVIYRGRLLGAVPKVYLPNYREFYERRHFMPGEGVTGQSITRGRFGGRFRSARVVITSQDLNRAPLRLLVSRDAQIGIRHRACGRHPDHQRQ